MATATERMVIEAAREVLALRTSDPDSADFVEAALADLEAAMDALNTEENASGVREQELTWDQVVTTDEAQSKNGRWYEVLSTEAKAGQVTVRFVGLVNSFTKPAGEAVKVRRSEMGQAADVLTGILKSGPS